jgi:hypothetical protein
MSDNYEDDLYEQEVNDDNWDAEHAAAEKGIDADQVAVEPKPPSRYKDPKIEEAMNTLFARFGLRSPAPRETIKWTTRRINPRGNLALG